MDEEKKRFFEKLSDILQSEGYLLDSDLQSSSELMQQKDWISKLLTKYSQKKQSLLSKFPQFDTKQLREYLSSYYLIPNVTFVFYAFDGQQLKISIIIDGDRGSSGLSETQFKQFEDRLDRAKQFAGGILKNAARGGMFFVFCDSNKAISFVKTEINKCKTWHFWSQLMIDSFGIDISSKTVSYNGLLVLRSLT